MKHLFRVIVLFASAFLTCQVQAHEIIINDFATGGTTFPGGVGADGEIYACVLSEAATRMTTYGKCDLGSTALESNSGVYVRMKTLVPLNKKYIGWSIHGPVRQLVYYNIYWK